METADIINRAAMRADVTNCMIRPAELLDGIKNGRFSILDEETLLITEKRTGYIRLYYFLTPGCVLRRISLESELPVYADITLRGEIGSKDDIFRQLGLIPFRTYIRFGMINRAECPKPVHAAVEADTGDIDDILELLYGMFDLMADTLPDRNELVRMITDGNVYKVVILGCLAGVLLYEDTGVKSYLRALAVSPEYRGKSVGSSLMSHYLSMHTPDKTKRFELWMDQENAKASALYRKLGYTPDGLKNYIYRRGGQRM